MTGRRRDNGFVLNNLIHGYTSLTTVMIYWHYHYVAPLQILSVHSSLNWLNASRIMDASLYFENQ